MTQEREGDILRELRELGRQLKTVVETLAQSEQTQELKQELEKGLTEISRQFETALKQLRESPKTTDLETQVRQAVEKAQQSQIVQEVRTGILNALRQLNEELSTLAEKAAKSQEGEQGDE